MILNTDEESLFRKFYRLDECRSRGYYQFTFIRFFWRPKRSGKRSKKVDLISVPVSFIDETLVIRLVKLYLLLLESPEH